MSMAQEAGHVHTLAAEAVSRDNIVSLGHVFAPESVVVVGARRAGPSWTTSGPGGMRAGCTR